MVSQEHYYGAFSHDKRNGHGKLTTNPSLSVTIEGLFEGNYPSNARMTCPPHYDFTGIWMKGDYDCHLDSQNKYPLIRVTYSFSSHNVSVEEVDRETVTKENPYPQERIVRLL